MGAMGQFFRWLLQSQAFSLETIAQDSGGKLFSQHVLCHRQMLNYFTKFWLQKKMSPATNVTKIDAIKRFVVVFEKVYNIRVHPQVLGALNDLKKGQHKLVEQKKASSLTIRSLKKDYAWMSQSDVIDIITLLKMRIMKWINTITAMTEDRGESES